jgi:hypothetical protein
VDRHHQRLINVIDAQRKIALTQRKIELLQEDVESHRSLSESLTFDASPTSDNHTSDQDAR